jgi:hypothetical protein
MKPSFLILIVISIVVSAGFTFALKAQTPPDGDTAKIVLTSSLPSDIAPKTDERKSFDTFSWQSFVALNWPADESGNPLNPEESTFSSNLEAPRVWQCYERPEEVFQQDRNASVESNNKCQKTMIFALSKEGEQADEIEGNKRSTEVKLPLIDQQNNYVVYEIRLNPNEAKQIRDNSWNKIENLNEYDTIDQCKKADCNLFQFSTFEGARPIEIKASWRVFDLRNSPEEKSRYYTTKQTLHIPAKYSTTGQDIEQQVELGLIGFHIAQKTFNKSWIWSTFEQVDNLNVDVHPIPPGLQPTLRNLDCRDQNNSLLENTSKKNANDENTSKCLAENTREKDENYLWQQNEPHAVMKKDGKTSKLLPTQVARLKENAVSPITEEMNKKWREKFGQTNSVWQYYQLMGSEWISLIPCGLVERKDNCRPIWVSNLYTDPTKLAFAKVGNVTMETYVEPVNASCIKCHSAARLDRDHKRSADFSFLFDEYAR